jgi:ribosome-binding factor A
MSLKQERMSDKLREILSELLMFHVTDPALRNVTVTRVELDAELEYADVYVNALGNESRKMQVMKGLERAGGFLRREAGGRIRLRRTPQFHFHWDLSLEHVEKIERALHDLKDELAKPTEPTENEGSNEGSEPNAGNAVE